MSPPKVRVMATSRGLALQVMAAMRRRELQGQAAEAAADLGVTVTLTKRRRVGVQNARLAAAQKRAAALKRFAFGHWSVRALARSGPGAKALWGSAVRGLAPTRLQSVRAAVVNQQQCRPKRVR